jgi:hypothetical protein
MKVRWVPDWALVRTSGLARWLRSDGNRSLAISAFLAANRYAWGAAEHFYVHPFGIFRLSRVRFALLYIVNSASPTLAGAMKHNQIGALNRYSTMNKNIRNGVVAKPVKIAADVES